MKNEDGRHKGFSAVRLVMSLSELSAVTYAGDGRGSDPTLLQISTYTTSCSLSNEQGFFLIIIREVYTHLFLTNLQNPMTDGGDQISILAPI